MEIGNNYLEWANLDRRVFSHKIPSCTVELYVSRELRVVRKEYPALNKGINHICTVFEVVERGLLSYFHILVFIFGSVLVFLS